MIGSRAVWFNGMCVGSTRRLGHESGMPGRYSAHVASWLHPETSLSPDSVHDSYTVARGYVISVARRLLAEMEKGATS